MAGRPTMRQRQRADAPVSKRHQDIILLVVLIGVLMGAIDTTIVILALPTMTQSLHSDFFTTIWAILGYLLVLAAFTTQLGRVGDIFGRGRMFNAGLGIFTFGSLLCGLSPNATYLIAFRVVQALGGALVQANSSAIIADTFERERMGRAFGYTTVGWNVGGAIGIVLGGALTTFLGWSFIFLINVPIGIIAIVLGLRYIKDNPREPGSVNLVSIGFLALILSLISAGAIDVAAYGGNYIDAGMIAAGLLLAPLYLRHERRSKAPTINMNVFKGNNMLKFSLGAAFLQSLGYLAVLFILTLYLQGVLGMSPLSASLLLLPGYVASGITSPYMGKLSDRLGPRIVATSGILLTCIAVLIYLTLNSTTPWTTIVVASLFSGFGGAMFWPANTSAVMEHTRQELYGATSGLLRMLNSIGTIFSYSLALSIAATSIPRQIAFDVFLGTPVKGGIPLTFINGIHAALAVSLVLLVAAGLLSFSRGKRVDEKEWHGSHK